MSLGTNIYELPADLILPICNKCDRIGWTDALVAKVKSLMATLTPAKPRPGELPPAVVKTPKPLKDPSEQTAKKAKAA